MRDRPPQDPAPIEPANASSAAADFPPLPPADAVVERREGPSAAPILLLCDHASNAIPADLGDLGLSDADRNRHIAYDVGARGVTLALAEALAAPAILSTFSRLVIDPNRDERDPTVLMRLYDRSIIAGNRHADAAEKERRLARFHRPYHRAVGEAIARAEATLGRAPLIVSIHSFTAQLAGRPPRPWQVGVLWDQDRATAQALLARLRAEPDLCVGDNEPYKGALPGDTMDRHGNARNVPHVLIEVRNDLIDAPASQRAWAGRLAPMIAELAATAPAGPDAAPR